MLNALPPNETIQTTAGHAYAIAATVKSTHSKADLFALAQARGLKITNYGESADVDGYKSVAIIALATSPASLPWSVPWPLSIVDKSAITEAAEETAPGAAALAQADAATSTAATVPTEAIAPPELGSVQSASIAGGVAVAGVAAAAAVAADLLSGEGPIARYFASRRRR